MGAPYIYDISRLRVKNLHSATYIYVVRRLRVNIGAMEAILPYFHILFILSFPSVSRRMSTEFGTWVLQDMLLSGRGF